MLLTLFSSFLASKCFVLFACANLALKCSVVRLLNSGVVIYLSRL